MVDKELGSRLYPDGEKSVLLLLHLQNAVIHRDGMIGTRGVAARVAATGLVERVQQAQRAADDRGVPVINVVSAFYDGAVQSTAPLLRQGAREGFRAGSWDAEIFAPLARHSDLVIEHGTMSAFAATDLAARLEELGVTRVVLSGVSTQLVVTATAFSASDLGLMVTVLADCCQAPSDAIHAGALSQLSAISSVAAVKQ